MRKSTRKCSIDAKRQALWTVAALFVAMFCFAGCRKEDMADQPRYHTFEESKFFADGQSARPLIEGTVPRGLPPVKDQLFAVSSSNVMQPEAVDFPKPLTAADLEVGHQKFDVFCSVCHGRLGDAKGMVVQRGFPQPPSFIMRNDANNPMTQRELNLQKVPVGHFYNVITYGYGAMYSYGDRIKPEDRWKIVAYVKALQLGSQSVAGSSAAQAIESAHATVASATIGATAAPTTQPSVPK